jgi:shikimate kinase
MNITLIGMAGVGKSVIGKALAKRLSFRFLDTDKIIENKMGMGLQEIIDEFGEESFLNIEEETTLGLKLSDKCVISTGGSIVYSKKAMKFLKKNSTVIFLDAPLRTIDSRVIDRVTRGIIHLKKGLPGIYKERLPLYKKYADIKIKLSQDYNRGSVVKNIIKKL